MPTALEKRIENFLDNDHPHLQKAVTVLNVKMWFVLAMLTMVLAAIMSPLIGTTLAGSK